MDATARFRKAIEIDPDFTLAHFDLARALGEQGKLDDAITHYREALRVRPEFAEAHHHVGRALEENGRLEEALEHYRQAVRLAPENALALNQLAWFLATCEQQELRDAAEAVRVAEKAFALTADQDPRLFDTLAAAYAAAGRMTDAIRRAEDALRLLASSSGQEDLKREIQERLQHYRENAKQ